MQTAKTGAKVDDPRKTRRKPKKANGFFINFAIPLRVLRLVGLLSSHAAIRFNKGCTGATEPTEKDLAMFRLYREGGISYFALRMDAVLCLCYVRPVPVPAEIFPGKIHELKGDHGTHPPECRVFLPESRTRADASRAAAGSRTGN